MVSFGFVSQCFRLVSFPNSFVWFGFVSQSTLSLSEANVRYLKRDIHVQVVKPSGNQTWPQWIQRHVEYYFRDQCRYFPDKIQDKIQDKILYGILGSVA